MAYGLWLDFVAFAYDLAKHQTVIDMFSFDAT